MTAHAIASGRTARVMGLVGVGHGLSHFYTLVLPPLFPLLKDHFGASYAALGLVIGLLNLSTAIAQVPAGVLVDRFGARRLLVLGMLASSAGVVIAALAGSYWVLLAAMLVTGLGNAAFHPADYAIMNAQVAPDRMGRAFGIHTFTGNVGFAAAPPVMLALIAVMDWRMALLLVGAAGLGVVALLLWQGALLATEADAPRGHDEARAARDEDGPPTRALFLMPVVLLCLAFYVVLAMVTSGVQSFAVAALVAGGQTELATANVALTAFLVASMLGVLAGGVAADRARSHTAFAVTGIVLSAVALVGAGLAGLPPAGVVAGLAVAGFLQGAVRPARDLIVRAAIPARAIGRVFGLVSTGGWVGFAITPVLYGYALDAGHPDAVFWLSGGFMALAVLTVVTVSRRGAAR